MKKHELTYISPLLRIKRLLFYRRWKCVPKKGHHRRLWNYERDDRIDFVCGWCGNITFVYDSFVDAFNNPDKSLCHGTRCLHCGRDVLLYYQHWIYHAEFSDGCELTQWPGGGIDSGGPKHAPHLAFVHGDFPILEWGYPDLTAQDFIYYGFKGSHPSNACVAHDIESSEHWRKFREAEKAGTLQTMEFYTAKLTNKNNPDKTLSATITTNGKESQQDIINRAKRDIEENNIVDNIDEWNLEIKDGAAIPWAD